jgi:hypothetical protein
MLDVWAGALYRREAQSEGVANTVIDSQDPVLPEYSIR